MVQAILEYTDIDIPTDTDLDELLISDDDDDIAHVQRDIQYYGNIQGDHL